MPDWNCIGDGALRFESKRGVRATESGLILGDAASGFHKVRMCVGTVYLAILYSLACECEIQAVLLAGSCQDRLCDIELLPITHQPHKITGSENRPRLRVRY